MNKFDFLNPELRVLNYTHVDMDGVGSYIVLRNYYKKCDVQLINYNQETKITNYIEQNKGEFDVIIFSDFTPINLKTIKDYGYPVLVLDHHESAKHFHNPDENVFIDVLRSGTKLCYDFYKRSADLSKLEELVEIINDYDLMLLKNNKSKFFNQLYWRYGFNWFADRFEHGKIELYQEEKDFLVRHSNEFKEFFSKLEVSDLDNNGVFVSTSKFLGDLDIKLRELGYQYMIIYRGDKYSIRANNDKINLVEVCKTLGKGGGHKQAVGIFYKFDEEFIRNIISLISGQLNANTDN